MHDYEVIAGLQALAAMVGDGHTFLQTSGIYHFFPLEVFWFGEQLRVVRAAAEYREALGARVIEIGKHPIHDVQNKLSQFIPQDENEWFVPDSSARNIVRVELLAASGILTGIQDAPFTFEDDSGRRFVLQISPRTAVTRILWEDAAARKPLYLQHPDSPFWFTFLPDSQTVYVDFRSYLNLEQNSYKLLEVLKRHSVNRLVIDMRGNGGGNYVKGREFLISKIQFMPSLNRAGRLFVIIGRHTFSAAMTNATDFRRETEAILVGEPTGARPNGYQENYWFTLPNSRIRASCATLHYRFQSDDAAAVVPDHRIDAVWESYRAGRDPVMEWILAQP